MTIDRITLWQGDITRLAADAIVNAANAQLTPGGAVGLAIHRAAGPQLEAECKTLPACSPGDAAITGAYGLQARYVIHAVGPSWHGGQQKEAERLAQVYRRCFELAAKHDVRTIAFPAISCGLYSYPLVEAARIAMRQTVQSLREHPSIERVTFALFADAVHRAFADALAEMQRDAID